MSLLRRISSPSWTFRRYLRGSTSGDSGGNRWRNRRPSYYSSRVLLEKFVKLTKYDCSLVAKSPCSLKVRGSFFDPANNVDRDKNRHVLNLLRSTGEASLSSSSTPSPPVTRKDSIEEIEEAILASSLSSTSSGDDEKGKRVDDHPGGSAFSPKLKSMQDAIMNKLQKKEDLSSDFDENLDGDKRDLRRIQQKKKKFVEEMTDDEEDEDDETLRRAVVPLHVLFYGRSHNRLDSYTIMNTKGQQQSHVYLTDASCVEEAETMFRASSENRNVVDPVGSFSIWQPKDDDAASEPSGSDDDDNVLPDEFASGFKQYVPLHVLAHPDDWLKTVFLVPTMMSKVYLEGEKAADVELDAALIEDLESVGVCTEQGSVRVKDLTAGDIRLASRFGGDVVCEGSLDGNLVAELHGDGDFVARYIEGPVATVTTQSGDVTVWGECRSARSHFFSRSGNVIVRDLYNQNYMSIKEEGNVTTNLVEGSVSIVVRKGDVNLTIDTLLDHSTVHVTEGDIIVTVPNNPAFRLNATAQRTEIAPKLLNAGDMFLFEKGGYETFTTTGVVPKYFEQESADNASDDSAIGRKVVSFHQSEPTLNMITNKGTITIKVKEEAAAKGASGRRAVVEEGFDLFT